MGLLLFLLACLQGTQPSEGLLRGRAVGEVRDASGAPWAQAEVVLVSRPIPHLPDVGEEDRVMAVTDELGRFRAEILRGRPYTAWAWGPPEALGRRMSQVVERMFVQRAVLLEEGPRLPAQAVRLTRMDEWAGLLPLHVRVLDQTGNRQVSWLEVPEDGRLTLPWLVGPEAWLEVFGSGMHGRFPITRAKVVRTQAQAEVALPDEHHAVVWAHDELGQPLAGAEVLQRLGDSLHPVGRTDARGQLAVSGTERGIPTFLRAAGQGFHPFGPVCVGTRVQDHAPVAAAPEDLFVRTLPAPRYHGRILGADGAPLARAQLWCAHHADHKGGAPEVWVVTTDDRGEFVLEGAAGLRSSVHLVLRERDLASLPARWCAGLLPVVFCPLIGQTGQGTRVDPRVVDLRRMCPVEFRVSDPTGAPAAHAGLCFAFLRSPMLTPWDVAGADAAADPLGCLRVLLPGGQRLGVRAVQGESMYLRGFETSAGSVAAGPARREIRLPSPRRVSGRLLDEKGRPLPGVTLHAHVFQSARWTYRSEEPQGLADPTRNSIRLLLPERDDELVALTGLIRRQTTTNEFGEYLLPMPPEPIQQVVLFATPAGVQDWGRSHGFEWTGRSRTGEDWSPRR